jgi:ribosomal protein S18 acetylase RimI-like enzyme
VFSLVAHPHVTARLKAPFSLSPVATTKEPLLVRGCGGGGRNAIGSFPIAEISCAACCRLSARSLRRTLLQMLLHPAVEADYAAIVDLANLAFRGSGSIASWNTEAVFIEGQRLNESLLREDLAAKPEAQLLTYRDDPDGPLLGTVLLDERKAGVWNLGLLSIRPDLQKRQLGRGLLAAAEDFARARGGRRIRMTVVNVRDTLIAWYERRGYRLNGETQPFPYGDERYGRPLRDDLHFVVLEKDI